MKEKQNQKSKSFWLELWELLEPSQKQIMVTLGFIVLSEIVNLVGPYILKIIIDQVTHFSMAVILPVIFFIILMFLVNQSNSLISYFKDKRIFKIIMDLEYYLPIRAQKKLVNLSLNYHEKENTGNKITKIEKGIGRISELIGNLTWEVAPTIIQLIATIIVLLIIDWRFALSVLFFSPIIVWITFSTNKALMPVRKKRFVDYEVASGIMGQSIMNINTVKSFVQEEREIEKFSILRRDIRFNELKEWFNLIKFRLVRNLLVDLGRSTILFLGLYLIYKGSLSIGSLVFVITLSEKSYLSLYRLSRFYDKAEEGAVAVKRFIDLVETENDIISPENGIKPKTLLGEIDFKNVYFQYTEAKENVLKNINLKLTAGTTNALVGPSGGGKTTLARMVYRHYDPQKGSVLLDGVDLRKYDLYEFRKFFAIVPQEVEIFNTTIAENISYAKPNATKEEIKKAAQVANAEEFINKLSHNYETEVGERGVKLSGGQRQRIGIARAILANPRVLIFDEATSNLDSYSEKLIQDAMEKISKGRTVIIIAHRLSTIRKADNIIVIEKGKIVEQGAHNELCKNRGGLYTKLLNLQKLGEVD